MKLKMYTFVELNITHTYTKKNLHSESKILKEYLASGNFFGPTKID